MLLALTKDIGIKKVGLWSIGNYEAVGEISRLREVGFLVDQRVFRIWIIIDGSVLKLWQNISIISVNLDL